MRRIELLSRLHDRQGFDCGSEQLNLFLKETARQHAERGISRTFVMIEENEPAPKRILGFFSLNICQLTSEALAPEQARRLPRTVPGVKLGRLAVAKEFQGQGIGKELLVAAMRKFVDVFNTVGGTGMFVDAKDLDAKCYYEQFGFVSLPSNALEMFLPLKTIQAALAGLP